MAAGLKAGVAHVELEPRLKDGFEQAVTKDLDGPLSRVSSKVSATGGKMTKAITLPIVAGVAAIGAGIVAAGMQLDDALDSIAVGTGAVGKNLTGLEDSFRTVAARVPNDMGQVATAIAELHKRTGQTGPELENLATKTLTLSRLTNTDLSTAIKNSTRLFGDWGIGVGQQAETLDFLFAVGQKTGIGVDTLSEKLVQFGGPLRQLGFTMEQSAGLLGKFEKEGVNTELVLGSMRIALGKFAKNDENPVETLKVLIDQIKNAGTAGEGTALAMEYFGARAGPDMAAAIREGRFELGDLMAQLENTDGSLDKSAAQTDGFSETFGKLRNSVILAVEPLATKLFSALDQLVPKLEPVAAFVGRLIEGFTNLDPKWQLVIAGIVAVVAAIGPLMMVIGPLIGAITAVAGVLSFPVVAIAALVAGLVLAYMKIEGFREVVDGVISWLVANVPPLIRKVVDFVVEKFAELQAWVDTVWPAIQEAVSHAMRAIEEIIGVVVDVIMSLWRAWGDDLARIAETMWNYVRETVKNGIDFVRSIIETVLALINGDWGKAWEGIKGAAAAVWAQIHNVISTAINLVKSTLGGVLSTIGEVWSGAWDKLRETAGTAIGAVVGFVAGLPGKLLELVGSVASAAGSIGSAILRGIVDGVSGAVSFVTDIGAAIGRAVKGVVNTLIDKVNNALEFTIKGPGFLPDVTLNPPDIPHLASGGVFSGLALVGEKGPELAHAAGMTRVRSNRDLASMLEAAMGDLVLGSRGSGPLVHVDRLEVRDATDVDLLARRVAFVSTGVFGE